MGMEEGGGKLDASNGVRCRAPTSFLSPWMLRTRIPSDIDARLQPEVDALGGAVEGQHHVRVVAGLRQELGAVARQVHGGPQRKPGPARSPFVSLPPYFVSFTMAGRQPARQPSQAGRQPHSETNSQPTPRAFIPNPTHVRVDVCRH